MRGMTDQERSTALVHRGDNGDCTRPMFEDGELLSENQRMALGCYRHVAKNRRRNVTLGWECGKYLTAARECGKYLTAAREEGERRTFTRWLKACEIPASSAYRYIKLFAAYPEVSQLGNFDTLTEAYGAAGIDSRPVHKRQRRHCWCRNYAEHLEKSLHSCAKSTPSWSTWATVGY